MRWSLGGHCGGHWVVIGWSLGGYWEAAGAGVRAQKHPGAGRAPSEEVGEGASAHH